ncbi:MAG TPA: class I SAM-dependent methyltransferase [Xanthomonadaceae bacterium]|nr:class I SAM-dependent methyltransferase [Xanthomonadaceae bacterium]
MDNTGSTQVDSQRAEVDAQLAGIAALARAQRFREARARFQALPDPGRRPEVLRLRGQVDWGCGDYDAAVAGFEAAYALAPEDVAAIDTLARACVSLGRLEQARSLLDRALERGQAEAALVLQRELVALDDGDLAASLARLHRSGIPGVDPHAYLAWRGLRLHCGLEAPGPIDMDHPRMQASWSAIVYANAHRSGARLFGTAAQVLQEAVNQAPAEGLVLECGVYFGRSIRYLAQCLPGVEIHGFDSFQGLPEDWQPGEPAGSYSTFGELPVVPDGVVLHRGWFDRTLPEFLSTRAGVPIRLLHVDCDLYSSTREVLAACTGHLVPGSVIVFDDYMGYPGSEQHEFRAFAEWVAERGAGYCYLAFTLLGREVAVRLL